LLLPFEFGLGGPIGSGRQWMSWIERDDLVRLIAHTIATPALEGPVNATAPRPERNADFGRALGRALHRPAVMPMPALPLRLLGGDFAKELLLGGQRVLPKKALASGDPRGQARGPADTAPGGRPSAAAQLGTDPFRAFGRCACLSRPAPAAWAYWGVLGQKAYAHSDQRDGSVHARPEYFQRRTRWCL
jgi:hypothetical protein